MLGGLYNPLVLYLLPASEGLSPEDVGFLIILSPLTTRRVDLSIKPAVSLFVTIKATNIAVKSLHIKQDIFYATKDFVPLFLGVAGKELFGFEGLVNLPTDDPVYRKIDCIFVIGNFVEGFLFVHSDAKLIASSIINPGRMRCYLFQDRSDGNDIESFGVGAVVQFGVVIMRRMSTLGRLDALEHFTEVRLLVDFLIIFGI